jgi:Domain of unkown function (DUF1775)
VTAAAAAGVLLAAGPALADIGVSPSTAAQTTGQNLTFTVPNPGACPVTRVVLTLPADTPVAEVYPLSVDDWAPQIIMRKLTTPLETIHGGAPATEATAQITWIAMPGKSIPTGKTAQLSIAIGPLPTVSRMQFQLTPSCADGKAGTTQTASLALTPPADGQAPAGHSGHGGTTGTGQTGTGTGTDPTESQYFEKITQDSGPGFWAIAGWVIAGLGVAGVVVALLRGRRKGAAEADDDASAPDEPKEPVTASAARITAWSYRDGPVEDD